MREIFLSYRSGRDMMGNKGLPRRGSLALNLENEDF